MLPEDFIISLQALTGFDKEKFIAAHHLQLPAVSIRENPLKNKHNLQVSELYADRVPWCDNGYYLQSRPVFTLDPAFHAGAYYVQEASSMFLEQAFKQSVDVSKSIKILDLCAAPGGKSTLLLSLISENNLLVSNEVIKSRVNVLTENMAKWGSANVVVTNNDPVDFTKLAGYFDVIVVDAPCSGSGLFRKDSDAVEEWSLQHVKLCSQRQQRILADIMPALKNEGMVIYSTCSYSKEENEDIIDWLVNNFEMNSLKLDISRFPGITETGVNNNFGYRFYPDKVKGEGFFIAVLKKNIQQNESKPAVFNKQILELPVKKELAIIAEWVKTEGLVFYRHERTVMAFPENIGKELSLLKQFLFIKKAGVKIGEIINNTLVPHHELAISGLLKEAVPFIVADKEQALKYLRKQDIDIKTEIKGWALVTFEGIGLGWIKCLGNRINNYYPKEWRILMQ